MNVGLSSQERADIRARYRAEDIASLWDGDVRVGAVSPLHALHQSCLAHLMSSFAEMAQAYFCANPEIPLFSPHAR